MPDEKRWIKTVGELKAKLADLPDDMLVVLGKDAEGNGFSPLAELTEERYLAETTWSGDLLDDGDYPDPVNNEVPVALLWPTN